jgi:hypothetical protein
MNRFPACVLLLAVVLGSSPGEGKPRKAQSLSKKQCFRICTKLVECLGMPHQSSTLAEVAICADDCTFESKDSERRPGWLCASRAEGCEALKQCNAGGKTEAPK